MLFDRRCVDRGLFAHFRSLSCLLLLSLALAACGTSATPTPAFSGPHASGAATQIATPTASTTAGSSTSRLEPVVEAPPTTTAPTPEPEPSPRASADTASVASELAITRLDKTVVLVRNGEQQTITKVNDQTQPECGDLEWSPDGYRLATEGGVYTFSADESKPPVLAPIAGVNFRWSPDGKRLAWLAGVDEHLDVIRAGGPDGDAAAVIAGAHWGSTGLLAWSPDGRMVASGPLEAATDGTGFKLVDRRSQNPVWSLHGSQLAWTTAEASGARSKIVVMVEQDGAQRALATIPIPLPEESAAAPLELERMHLRWIRNGTALLAPVSTDILLRGGGTYLIQNGEAALLSPHVLCDLAPDGERMVAPTADQQIVVVRLADGVVEAELGPGLDAAWRPLRHDPPPAAPLATKSPTLRLASPPAQGAAVTELQQRLQEQGYAVGAVDGIFGPRTEQAVRAFQRQQGLAEDGVVGPQTWAILRLDAERTTKQFFNSQ